MNARENWEASDGTYLKHLRGLVGLWLRKGIDGSEGHPLPPTIDGNNDTRYWAFGGGWMDAQEVNEALVELELIEAPLTNEYGQHDTGILKVTAKGIYTAMQGELPDE